MFRGRVLRPEHEDWLSSRIDATVTRLLGGERGDLGEWHAPNGQTDTRERGDIRLVLGKAQGLAGDSRVLARAPIRTPPGVPEEGVEKEREDERVH